MSKSHLTLVPAWVPAKTSLANDDVWERELDRLAKRIDKIRALKNGSAEVKTVSVEGHYVKRHWVKDHERILIRRIKPRRSRPRRK